MTPAPLAEEMVHYQLVTEDCRTFPKLTANPQFVLLLPNCDEPAATRFAERVRLAVASATATHDATRIAVTLSIGIAVGRGEDLQLDALYRRADRALYAAKRGGRNQVRSAPRPHSAAWAKDEPAQPSTEAEAPPTKA